MADDEVVHHCPRSTAPLPFVCGVRQTYKADNAACCTRVKVLSGALTCIEGRDAIFVPSLFVTRAWHLAMLCSAPKGVAFVQEMRISRFTPLQRF